MVGTLTYGQSALSVEQLTGQRQLGHQLKTENLPESSVKLISELTEQLTKKPMRDTRKTRIKSNSMLSQRTFHTQTHKALRQKWSKKQNPSTESHSAH
jgi:hypothetical protein